MGAFSLIVVINLLNRYWNGLCMASIAKSKPLSKAFVPRYSNPEMRDIDALKQFIEKYKCCVITGAGVSTESGIPDYRSETVGLYARSKNRPLDYKDFLRSAEARKKYWARNFAGWSKFSTVEPNLNHRLIRKLEQRDQINWLITQNVDALHRKAGSKRFTELHGCTHEVECLSCDKLYSRDIIQHKIKKENANFDVAQMEINPDGDVFLPDDRVQNFQAPLCSSCGGILKPRVVFFGDNVRKEIVEECKQKVSEAEAVLTVGTTLQTYSSYRLALQAQKEGKPIFIINIGPTRADKLADYKIGSLASLVLSEAIDR